MHQITSEALQDFDVFRGEVDPYLAANGRQPDLRAWTIINVLIGDMILLRNGHAADAFAQQLEADIHKTLAAAEVFAELKEIADRKIKANNLKG
ncbi:hypothetical protein EGT74_00570 [Chitinophaga lutea]|uniref:Uncharacterized protein n=1 Tax=Chitinophaga lutea TaxID=2488634 RepID=A0A3N4PVU1_9BACT|nr:hypothetical protein [Chitinophaga lutea]RPE12086.1 hypothetical protein EGT74_00570 [Chitinophaga lutea]